LAHIVSSNVLNIPNEVFKERKIGKLKGIFSMGFLYIGIKYGCHWGCMIILLKYIVIFTN